jgi:hypothetical protein
MRKLNTEYKLKLGRLNKELIINEQKKWQSEQKNKNFRTRSLKHYPSRHRSRNPNKKSKRDLFNSTNLSTLPYKLQKTNNLAKSTNMSSMKTTYRATRTSMRSSVRTSKMGWRTKNVNPSGFQAKKRKMMIDFAGKDEYFEKEVDGEMKLFRRRYVPVNELE